MKPQIKNVSSVKIEIDAAMSSKTIGNRAVFRVRKGKTRIETKVINIGAEFLKKIRAFSPVVPS
tara:strand:+ start:819 stop:1010 length:192 start_codon:yes stop_codon:yes gene_type:complete